MELGFDWYITPYNVRYSAITVALSNGADTYKVRSAVDQKSMTAIDSYVSDVELQKLQDLMRKLVVSGNVAI